ncbi:hypothetical protein [Sphingomonas morindae]|uniref:Protein TonB n=1 Tax=Sphingomonas morindae TaxID=1541170 RepID=A0ABY4X4D4_9SPHN|nr:hypothetical protein [Sphingomonas morindae]USI71720.1 hypothetical protein LHA26_10310 [Sphingomonas morindae]
MRSAPVFPPRYAGQASPRDRLVAALLALAITGLILFMLVMLGVIQPAPPRGGGALTTIALAPGETRDTSASRKPAQAARAAHAAAAPAPAPARTPPPPPPVPAPVPAWNVIPLSSNELASLDHTMSTSHGDRNEARGAEAGAGAGAGAAAGGASQAGGSGGGERYYDVAWYSRPTPAMITGYLSDRSPRTGFGMIACRMIADYRVEDCRELDETPGSGFARALRQAAWQFRVLPPRIGGRQQLGVWVRIQWTFTEGHGDSAG